MCNNLCEICGDLEDCNLTPLSKCLSYIEATNIINNDLIYREDKSYNDYIKEYYNCPFQKKIN